MPASLLANAYWYGGFPSDYDINDMWKIIFDNGNLEVHPRKRNNSEPPKEPAKKQKSNIVLTRADFLGKQIA